jgi:hypothetical protein
MNIKGICFLFLLIVILSCNGSKKQLSFYNNADVEEDSTEVVDSPFDMTISYDPGEEVVVPFIEQGGVKLIDVTINRLYTVKMILDSGCSSTLISIADAKYLYDKGYIDEEEYKLKKSQVLGL